MKQLYLELELQSPTCIAQRPTAPGQFTETMSYLSGTVLRGGMATLWLRGQRYEDLSSGEQEHFQALFLTRKVSFGHAWPLKPNGQTWIVPRTAWTAKRTGGWKGDGYSGVVDVLPQLLQGLSTDDGLDRLGQEFAVVQGGRWQALPMRRRLITRTAVGHIAANNMLPDRGVADQGQLYSFEALEAGQQFSSHITGPDDLITHLEQIVQRHNTLIVGQGRSRGMGQVLCRHHESILVEARPEAQLRTQIEAFSLRVGVANDQLYIPITLESDLILRDHYLLPCSSGDPQVTLGRYLGDLPNSMQLRLAVQDTRWLGGWDELRRIPRPAQLAVQPGSVWVYSVARDDLADAIKWWLTAERDGLGERRTEGFGRVRVVHPLHGEAREVW